MDKMVKALSDFQKAYVQLLEAWDEFDINNTDSIDNYPFHLSFDELNITDWCFDTIKELKRKN